MAEVNLNVAMESTSQEIKALLEAGITVSGNVSAVKKVQRGTTNVYARNNDYYIDIPISEVNLEKATVFVEHQLYDGTANTLTSSGDGRRIIGALIDENTIRLYMATTRVNSSGQYAAWQVVEYY